MLFGIGVRMYTDLFDSAPILAIATIAASTGFGIWGLVFGGLSIAGRRVPPIISVLPGVLLVALAGFAAMVSLIALPWDPSLLTAEARLALALPDAHPRIALLPAVLPGFGVLILCSAIAGPLRGPRVTWPPGLAVLFIAAAAIALTTGGLLDLAVFQSGATLLLCAPLAALTLIALVRGRPESSGPEAGVVAAVSLGHVLGASTTAWIALARLEALASWPVASEPVHWRAIGSALAFLALFGVAAIAATGTTAERGRNRGALAAMGTLALWAPITLLGALAQVS